MHKSHAKEFTMFDFSCEHLFHMGAEEENKVYIEGERYPASEILYNTVEALNYYRHLYLETKDKKYWWQMIQLLPSSYNQKRTLMLNYEVLANIYEYRKNHKLDEWRDFCKWIESLPYSEIITSGNNG
jgi:hypothetical protein